MSDYGVAPLFLIRATGVPFEHLERLGTTESSARAREYLSLEIFHRWLLKAGELEVTEMLPDANHLCWQEADGRRTFELRTLIVPQS